ncbi:uncharacterized protein METZ01_LOCUS465246 [marine metagenome]|uniref:Nitrogen regulatory protein P-II n=1 Tax=marine metagenome TaxID=408172 RepID=A0A383AXG3_9ZZZZ
MKRVDAIIKPFKLEGVRQTLTEAKGFGRQKGHREIYCGSEYTVDFLPKLKLELVMADGQPGNAVKSIQAAANTGKNTGKIGDGKISITSVESATRIRIGESGENAL